LTEVRIEPFLADVAAKARQLLNGRLQVAQLAGAGSLRADSQRLTQALINLLKNAREHTPVAPRSSCG